MGQINGKARLFEVDADLTQKALEEKYNAMLDELYKSGSNIGSDAVPYAVLEAHGFHPYGAGSFCIPDRHLGQERMKKDGIAFASCCACMYNCDDCGVCQKYGGETDRDPMNNMDCCKNEYLYQILDGDEVVEYFVLQDPDFLKDPAELLLRLAFWFPKVKAVMEQHGKKLCIRNYMTSRAVECLIP